jgi:hypothetical protein
MPETQHPKNQTGAPKPHDLVKPGSTMDPKGHAAAPPPAQGQQQAQSGIQGAWPQPSEQDQKAMQERQQQAWEMAAEREKSNNPATRNARMYDKNAPGMHPANQPAPDTKINKGTRLDLEDVTGNPGGRGINPDAPANSINGPPDSKTGRIESINEPSHVNQNWPQRTPDGVTPSQGPLENRGAYPEQQNAVMGASINEPPGSQVIPPGAGQGTGEERPGVNPPEGGTSATPEIDELEPDEIKVGSPDTVLTVHGSGFVQGSVIQFGPDNDLETAFISETQLSGPLKPSEWGEGVVQVRVKNADGGAKSEEVEFEFLAETPTQTKRTKPKPKGKKSR